MPPEYIVSERPAVFSHRRSALRTAQTVRFFKPPSLEGFVETMRPETGVLRYLAMENDERVWPVSAIVQTARSLGVPAITDAFHHGLNPGGLTLREALDPRSLPGSFAEHARRSTSRARTHINRPGRTPTRSISKTGTRY